MKKHLLVMLIVFCLASVPVSASQLPDELISDAILVLQEIGEQPDAEQLYSVLKKAWCGHLSRSEEGWSRHWGTLWRGLSSTI